MTKKTTEPTKEEIDAENLIRWQENLEAFHAGRDLAKVAFTTEIPTFEQAVGIGQILESGVERDVIVPLIARAEEIAEKIGVEGDAYTSSVLTIFQIVLDDDEAEVHLAAAEVEAKTLAKCTHETILDVYFQIYGVEEEDLD